MKPLQKTLQEIDHDYADLVWSRDQPNIVSTFDPVGSLIIITKTTVDGIEELLLEVHTIQPDATVTSQTWTTRGNPHHTYTLWSLWHHILRTT